MATDPACCGACAHLAGANATAPSTPPLRFELDPEGAPRDAWLVFRGHAVALTRPVTVIGRSPACDVVIRDDAMSRRTCSISFDPDGRCFVTDLASTCGVVVGGQRIARAGLHERDRVFIGNTILVVERRAPAPA
jgi:pSer/pThr/pTyr-binding forkhead associated (FHA) protein